MNMSVVTEGDLGFVIRLHAHFSQPMCSCLQISIFTKTSLIFNHSVICK